MRVVKTVSLYVFYGLLAYMPLHILLSTWLGTSFGVLEFAKIAKEFVMLVGAGCALIAWLQTGQLKQALNNRIMQLIIIFVVLNILLVLTKPTDLDAKLLGLAYNTRFLIFFVYAILLTRLFDAKKLLKISLKIVLTVGAGVVLFGIIQYTLLPNDALQYLGYTRENGVLPAFFIDDKPDLERIMSTVRDPNSLGSYLIIITSLCASLAIYAKTKKRRYLLSLYGLMAIIAIFWTFSRSALIGMVLSLAVVAYFVYNGRTSFVTKYKQAIVIGIAASIFALGALFLVFKDTYVVQNVVFHADQSTVLEDPNQLRTRFWGESVVDIAESPFGYGPGTAGLASIRNDQQTVLNENYYLQTGYELGVFGFIVFVILLALIAISLFRLAANQDAVAIALFASFTGLAVTNFLVHIWANEAVAYTWWGLAGLVLGSSLFISNNNKQAKAN